MKKFFVIFLVIGILFASTGTYASTGLNLKDLFTDQTLHELKEGEKVNFANWNEIVVSVSEKEINEVLINGLLKNYMDANPNVLPGKTVYQSAEFNMTNETLSIAVLYGKLKIRCNAQVDIDTSDDDILSINNPKLRVFGIPIPGFITKWILKDVDSYEIAYKDITGADSPIQVNRIGFSDGLCHVQMVFPEDKVVNTFHTVVPNGPVELLKDKRISDYVDMNQLTDIHFYISEDTVNRVFNEQLLKYVESGDTVIPEGLQIKQVLVSLTDRLLSAKVDYMGIGMNVQADFEPYCKDNVVGIDMGEMYLDGQQIPSVMKEILEKFTKNIRFDLVKAGIPSFIRLKGLTLLEKELDVNLSLDLLDREPVTMEQLEFLLGSGVNDQNAFFEYFAPVNTLSSAVENLLNEELLQSTVGNILEKAPIPEDLHFLINKDLIRVTDISMNVLDQTARLVLNVWNMPMELKCRFSLTSEGERANLSFYEPDIIFDGQTVPENVVQKIIGDGLIFTATFNEISEFLCIDELVVKKFILDDTGLVIHFTLHNA